MSIDEMDKTAADQSIFNILPQDHCQTSKCMRQFVGSYAGLYNTVTCKVMNLLLTQYERRVRERMKDRGGERNRGVMEMEGDGGRDRERQTDRNRTICKFLYTGINNIVK